MPDPTPAVPAAPAEPPKAESPTGQLVGLSALYNKLPSNVQEGIAYAVIAAGAVVALNIAQPGLLPAEVVRWAALLASVGAPLGLASAGSRK
jgi:hypothetical protein